MINPQPILNNRENDFSIYPLISIHNISFGFESCFPISTRLRLTQHKYVDINLAQRV